MDIDQKSKFCCPQCGAENIQNFEIAYRMGVSHIATSTTGVGISSSLNIGIGVAGTTGIQISALSRMVAPPLKREYLKNAFALYCIFLGVTGLFATGLNKLFNNNDFIMLIDVLIVFFVPFFVVERYVSTIKYWNRIEYPKLVKQWRQSYICFRCGHKFTIK